MNTNTTTNGQMTAEQIALVEDLVAKLAQGVVNFTYRKKDGTTRTACGTNKPSIVPNYYTIKGANITFSTEVVRYYDFEKAAFRSFRKANLISYAA